MVSLPFSGHSSFFFFLTRPPPPPHPHSSPTRRSPDLHAEHDQEAYQRAHQRAQALRQEAGDVASEQRRQYEPAEMEEHTSELQSLRHLVCRLLLEKKKNKNKKK